MKIIKKLLVSCMLLLCYHFCVAQFTLEPAITIKPLSLVFGAGDFGVSNLSTLPINRKFSLASYTSITNRFFQIGIKGGNNNTDIRHRIEMKQLFGIGVHFYRPKSVHSVYAFGGFGFTTFKEQLVNTELVLDQIYEASHFGEKTGVLYTWKRSLKEHMNFTLRTYLPLVSFEGVRPDFLEMTMEIGFAFSFQKKAKQN